jgi:hypothetical protein
MQNLQTFTFKQINKVYKKFIFSGSMLFSLSEKAFFLICKKLSFEIFLCKKEGFICFS